MLLLPLLLLLIIEVAVVVATAIAAALTKCYCRSFIFAWHFSNALFICTHYITAYSMQSKDQSHFGCTLHWALSANKTAVTVICYVSWQKFIAIATLKNKIQTNKPTNRPSDRSANNYNNSNKICSKRKFNIVSEYRQTEI